MLSKNTLESSVGGSRRSFLAKMGIGIAALAVLSVGLIRPGAKQPTASGEFPGPDSIFHPAQDPRQDPRRHS